MAAVVASVETNTAPFPDAYHAIRFAYTRDGSPQRPSWTRMAEGARDFQALQPIDAAAQAGMVLQALRNIEKTERAVLVAKAAPHVVACFCRRDCCSGRRMNRPWHEAISLLAEESGEIVPPKAGRSVRSAILIKIYAGNVSLLKIADKASLDPETVAKYHRAILRWLRGAPPGPRQPPIPGIESSAWEHAEDALRDAKLIA